MNPTLLLAIPMLPLIAAIIAGFFGKAIGRAGAHSVTIAGVAVSTVLSSPMVRSLCPRGHLHKRGEPGH